jgi:hypothetical protein
MWGSPTRMHEMRSFARDVSGEVAWCDKRATEVFVYVGRYVFVIFKESTKAKDESWESARLSMDS